MLPNMKFKSTNGSGSVAAAYLIFCVGLVGATIVTGLSFRQQPESPLIVLAVGGILALLTIGVRVRPQLPSEMLCVFARGQRRPETGYVPKIIKSQPTRFGTNHPPTVEEIRDLKEIPPYWVPSRSRSRRTSLRQG